MKKGTQSCSKKVSATSISWNQRGRKWKCHDSGFGMGWVK